MVQANTGNEALKEVVKEALIEALQEHRELFHEILSEALEDFALTAAIREGQETEECDREEILQLLRKKS